MRGATANLLRSSDSVATLFPLRKDICWARVRRVTGTFGGRVGVEPLPMKLGMKAGNADRVRAILRADKQKREIAGQRMVRLAA